MVAVSEFHAMYFSRKIVNINGGVYMPVRPTYPGVYIEEVSSGVRTITGVATSIAAFVGRTLRGPENEPISINSYGDFERIFGGLWTESPLSFAVRDFYLNGGSQAIIVRLFNPPPTPAVAAGAAATAPSTVKAAITCAGLTFEAASPGSWGSNLRAVVDIDVSKEVALQMGLDPSKADQKLFNLTITDTSPGGAVERFLNLTIIPRKSRSINKVLENESKLLQLRGELPSPMPAPIIAAYTAQEGLITALKATPQVPADVDAAKTAIATAANNLKSLVPTAGSDGIALSKNDFSGNNLRSQKKGLFALEKADLFNLLCIPPHTLEGDLEITLIGEAAAYCEERRAMLLVDPPSGWNDKDKAREGFTDPIEDNIGTRSINAAIFFPRLKQPNPLRNNQIEDFVPCGAVAGIFARTDSQRGVWKAPAGLEATLVGVPQLSVPLTDAENGELNPLGINCLRAFPIAGRVVWGSRTMRGADQLASEYKYIPVRRLTLFLEESLYRGTQFAVFEPNDEPLWAQLRLNIGAFMQNLFRQGAFQGRSPREAYFVKCDKETNPQNDINLGIVNVVVGFAPLKPAEFVVIKIQQIAGQIDV
jgi:uncharacterized protein